MRRAAYGRAHALASRDVARFAESAAGAFATEAVGALSALARRVFGARRSERAERAGVRADARVTRRAPVSLPVWRAAHRRTQAFASRHIARSADAATGTLATDAVHAEPAPALCVVATRGSERATTVVGAGPGVAARARSVRTTHGNARPVRVAALARSVAGALATHVIDAVSGAARRGVSRRPRSVHPPSHGKLLNRSVHPRSESEENVH